MFDYCIIMAGGSGTRLLPASNSRANGEKYRGGCCVRRRLCEKNGEEPLVLIAKKGETQAVKDIAEKIKLAGKTHLL